MKSEIIRNNGQLTIAVDGKPIDSLAFKSFRPTKNNVSDFYKAGVRVFNVYCSGLMSALKVPYSAYGETWFGEGDYNFESLDRQFEMFLESAPKDSYFMVNIHLDSREWWHEQNPGRSNSFTHLSQIAADEKWRKDTADYLKATIKHCEEKYGDRVVTYFLLGGHTTEWFSDFDYEESHPIKLEAYRKYLGDENATIPVKEQLEKPASQIFLDPISDKDVITYRRFHNELIADTVLYYAKAAQEVLNHKKLVGVFFGYILELGGRRLWEAGSIEYDKIYASDDIDMFATPSSYQFRTYDSPSACMLLSDTLDHYGKMYFVSFDHMTYNVLTLKDNPRRLSDDKNVVEAMANMQMYRKNMLENAKVTIDVMQREFMQKIYRRVGMWWFDMLEGWYYDDELMAGVKDIVDVYKGIKDIKAESAAEVAVFVCADSLYYVNKLSTTNASHICNQRTGLSYMGTPYDIYSMADLKKVNAEKYKVIFFLDSFYISDEHREYINNVLKKNGRSIIFAGPADYVNDDGMSINRMEKMLEMKVEKLDSAEKDVVFGDIAYGYKAERQPVFCVNDESIENLGTFSSNDRCGIALKKNDDYKIYYSAVGNLPAELLQLIAKDAGVHIYTKCNVATFINSSFIGVYNTKSDVTEVTLPNEGCYKEIFSGKIYSTENGKIKLPTYESPSQMLTPINLCKE